MLVVPGTGMIPGDRASADRATADEAALGRDDQVLGVGVQCLADQQLIGVGSVDISGVDQGHARFDGLPQKRDSAVTAAYSPQRFGPVSRIAP